jgi:hypothetical protein
MEDVEEASFSEAADRNALESHRQDLLFKRKALAEDVIPALLSALESAFKDLVQANEVWVHSAAALRNAYHSAARSVSFEYAMNLAQQGDAECDSV